MSLRKWEKNKEMLRWQVGGAEWFRRESFADTCRIQPAYDPVECKKYEELENRAQMLIELYPDSGVVWKMLGYSLQMEGKDALTALRKATELLPDDAEAHNNLGIALKERGFFDDAMASYQRAVAIKPDFAAAHDNLGTVYKDIGLLDDAELSYCRAVAIKSDFAEAHNNLGTVRKNLGQIDNAEASYRRALVIKPDFAIAHFNLAAVLKSQGRVREAEIICCKLMERNQTAEVKSAAIVLMANIAADEGQFEKAENLFRQAISIKSELPEAWAGITRTRKMTNSDSDAAWLAEAQRIADTLTSPRKEAPLRYALGKYYDDVKNFEQAFLNYRRANELTKFYCKKYVKQNEKLVVDAILHFYDRTG